MKINELIEQLKHFEDTYGNLSIELQWAENANRANSKVHLSESIFFGIRPDEAIELRNFSYP